MRVVTLCATVALLALAGCGGSDDDEPAAPAGAVAGDQRGILGTVDRLQAASRSGDGAAICDEVFTARLARSIADAAGRSCAAEVRRTLFAPDASLAIQRDVQVDGARATAVVREQNGNVSQLSFVRDGDTWRIDAITPQEGS